MGFSDEQICRIMNDGKEDDVYEKRKAAGITRVFKMVDTCTAEFEAKTPYFYSTFETRPTFLVVRLVATNESKVSDKKKIIVLGSVLTVSARELNLIIAVCMACWLLKNAVMKPSW